MLLVSGDVVLAQQVRQLRGELGEVFRPLGNVKIKRPGQRLIPPTSVSSFTLLPEQLQERLAALQQSLWLLPELKPSRRERCVYIQ